MAKKDKAAHVSETPATQLLRAHGVPFTEHPYDYVEHGGSAESARPDHPNSTNTATGHAGGAEGKPGPADRLAQCGSSTATGLPMT